jgi:uncharacterized protein YecT (DUF1311 family)
MQKSLSDGFRSNVLTTEARNERGRNHGTSRRERDGDHIHLNKTPDWRIRQKVRGRENEDATSANRRKSMKSESKMADRPILFFRPLRAAALGMIATALLAAPPVLAPSTSAHAASFDCEGKTLQPDEKVICDTRSLNDADVKMATSFELISGLMAMGSRGTLQDQQTVWLKARQSCGADAACIKASYEDRLKQLDDAYKHLNRPL